MTDDIEGNKTNIENNKTNIEDNSTQNVTEEEKQRLRQAEMKKSLILTIFSKMNETNIYNKVKIN